MAGLPVVLQALMNNPYWLGPAGVMRSAPDFAARVAPLMQATNPDLWQRLGNPGWSGPVTGVRPPGAGDASRRQMIFKGPFDPGTQGSIREQYEKFRNTTGQPGTAYTRPPAPSAAANAPGAQHGGIVPSFGDTSGQAAGPAEGGFEAPTRAPQPFSRPPMMEEPQVRPSDYPGLGARSQPASQKTVKVGLSPQRPAGGYGV